MSFKSNICIMLLALCMTALQANMICELEADLDLDSTCTCDTTESCMQNQQPAT